MVIFRLLCQIALFVMDIMFAIWLPLKQTIHYYEINDTLSKKENLNPEEIELKTTSGTKLRNWSYFWISQGILIFVTHELLWFFPFAYEFRVLLGVLMAHPAVQIKFSYFVK